MPGILEFMKPSRLTAHLVLAALVAASAAAQPSGPTAVRAGAGVTRHEAAPGAIRVLLVGNSLTYWNEMPRMLEQMAASGGAKRLFVEFCGAGGLALRQHWERGEVAGALAAEHWDFVVLQGQSVESTAFTDEFLKYGQLLAGEIRRKGASTVLFLTWSVRGEPQAPVTIAYRHLAEATGAAIAPVGIAWERVLKQGHALHDGSGVHPNLAGTYLTACVLYAAVTGSSPVGLPYRLEVRYGGGEPTRPGLDTQSLGQDLARGLQQAAWDAVSTWR